MIKIVSDLKEADFVTHAGNFHADDIFSTVFLEKLYKDMSLIRLKEYQDDKSKLAYDIGLGPFDHHGSSYDQKELITFTIVALVSSGENMVKNI